MQPEGLAGYLLKNVKTRTDINQYRFQILMCPRGDSNSHSLSATTPSK